jgi:hypothetical protein
MPLRTFILPLILPMSLLFFLAGCLPTRHPLGISDEDWQVMSLDQRLQAQEKQAEFEHADRVRKAEQKAAPESEAVRQPVQPEARRAPAAPVRYGERLQCVLSQAKVRIADKWRPVESTVLDVSRGQVAEFTLVEPSGQKGRLSLMGFARFDGQILTLCPSADENRREGCARVLGTFEDFRRGIDQSVEANGFLRSRLHCHLGPGAGMPPQLISAKSGEK